MSSRLDVRLDPNLKSRFEEAAKRQGKSMSDVVRELIEMYVAMAENELDIAELIKQAIEGGREEAKLILTLDVSMRYPGCGWRYLWKTEVALLLGDAEVIELQYDDNDSECRVDAKIAVIPRAVPTILAEYYEDGDPSVSNHLTLHIFDGRGWKSITVDLGDKRLNLDLDTLIYPS